MVSWALTKLSLSTVDTLRSLEPLPPSQTDSPPRPPSPPPATEPVAEIFPEAPMVDAAAEEPTTLFSRFKIEFWWMKIDSESSCEEQQLR